jgi:hypothetical protein
LFNLRETHYPTLIQAFYFNAAISSEKNQIISEVKTKKIRITEELLGNLLILPTKGNQVYGPTWFAMLDVDKSTLLHELFEPRTPISKNPPSSKLKHDFKMLHNMCLHSIFPRKGSKDKVTENDMMMIYHMSKGIELNLHYVMIQHMINTIENGHKKISLPYGMFFPKFSETLKSVLKVKKEKIHQPPSP